MFLTIDSILGPSMRRSRALRTDFESLRHFSLGPVVMADNHILRTLRVKTLPEIKFFYSFS